MDKTYKIEIDFSLGTEEKQILAAVFITVKDDKIQKISAHRQHTRKYKDSWSQLNKEKCKVWERIERKETVVWAPLEDMLIEW